MNDAVPVVAAPPARDHAPPDRGQEPAPSDAFAAALGAAQPAEAPRPAADPTARTAPAEGTKAEGDSSGPDTRKTADAGASAVSAAALAVALPAVALAPEAVPAAPANAQAAPPAAGAVAAMQPQAGVPAPVAMPPAKAGSEAPQPAPQATAPAAETASPRAPATPSAESPAASIAAPAEQRPTGGEKPAPATAGTAQPEPAVEESAAAAQGATGQPVPTVRPAHRPAASRAGRSEDTPVRPGRGAAPAARSHAAPQAERSHDMPGTHGAGASADAPAARPNDLPAATHTSTQTESPAAGRPADPAPAIDRAAPGQATQDARPRVRVHDVPDVARATLRVAVRGNGNATARISLHPADLGGVRITMRVHDGAVAATLTAETEAAAQALVQTASDLRRSLEGQGLQITSLDVHVAGDGPASSGDRRQASDLAQAMSTTDGTVSEDAVDITTELLHLVPLGTQVDVLA